jgi:predicted Na+-dependent transporter
MSDAPVVNDQAKMLPSIPMRILLRVRAFVKKHWNSLGIALAVLVAWLYPALGSKSGPLYPAIVTKILIVSIFIGPGLTMKLDALLKGFAHWRLVSEQVVTFKM